jgi:hypothetical protein
MKNKPENCICDDEMDVACPFHGQKALDEKTGYYLIGLWIGGFLTGLGIGMLIK